MRPFGQSTRVISGRALAQKQNLHLLAISSNKLKPRIGYYLLDCPSLWWNLRICSEMAYFRDYKSTIIHCHFHHVLYYSNVEPDVQRVKSTKRMFGAKPRRLVASACYVSESQRCLTCFLIAAVLIFSFQHFIYHHQGLKSWVMYDDLQLF